MEVGKHVDMTQTKKYRVVYAEMITYVVRHFEVAQCQTSVPDPTFGTPRVTPLRSINRWRYGIGRAIVTTRPFSERNNLVNTTEEILLKSFAGSYSAYSSYYG